MYTATLASMDTPSKTPEATSFAELHCLSNYSFLRGASHPEELVQEATGLGYRALAITDECSMSGVVKAHLAAKDSPLKLIVGAEFHCIDGFTLVLLAPSRTAYGQLCTLITRLRRRAKKGTYHLTLSDLDQSIDECIALWIPFGGEHARAPIEPQSSTHAVHRSRVSAATANNGISGDEYGIRIRKMADLLKEGAALKARFPRLYIALELFLDQHDLDRTATALTLSMRLRLPMVASNDVHLHHPARKPLQDVLTAIRYTCAVDELGFELQSNSERHLQPIATLIERYPPELLSNSVRIANQCHFNLDELRYEYPAELVPPQYAQRKPSGASAYLRDLTWHGAKARWPEGTPEPVQALIEKELGLIGELNYEHYFLTVYDIVQFARSKSILCQGRGSAANSAVCYCLFITEVDPDRMHLLFERFVSKERNEPPDIDVDFEHERREEVIQYIYTRYSRERAALAATLITYRPKSAIRDVGKALGLDIDLLDLLAKSMAWWDNKDELAQRFINAGIDPKSRVAKQFLFLVQQILGFPRHLSQHVGGFLISRGPISQLVPVENAAMVDRTVIQWDKDDLEALGLLKIDVLALGMLTAIRKALDMHNAFFDQHLSVAAIPAEDQATYAMLQRGDSVGVFQVESRAQMAMLPRLKPQNFYDLVVEVAIVRPGPIQGDMVHPYLRRRQGLETPTYSNDAVRRVLERTLGVPIFQEQVIELAMVAAGFTAGEADQLRRAMAAWKRRGGLAPFQDKLINGMLERGHDMDFAERVFKQIQGFGEYGFPESHAASFALLVYISAWIKQHSPAAFYAGLMNSLPMGFYSPSQLIQDARRHKVEVLGVDVQHSHWDHQLVPGTQDRSQPGLRLGLRLVKGFRKPAAERLVTARNTPRNTPCNTPKTTDQKLAAPFYDQADLKRRARLDRQSLEFLARAGALNSLSKHRHQAHWDVAGLSVPTELEQVAEKSTGYRSAYRTDVDLSPPTENEDMLADYRYTSLTLGPHPMTLLRKRGGFKRCQTALSLSHCRHGQFVRIAGLVTGRQRPGSAAGVMFVTLEDETGNSNIVVWTSVLEKFRAALLQGHLLLIKGVVERENEVIHVVAGHISDLSHELHEIAAFKSRDFH